MCVRKTPVPFPFLTLGKLPLFFVVLKYQTEDKIFSETEMWVLTEIEVSFSYGIDSIDNPRDVTKNSQQQTDPEFNLKITNSANIIIRTISITSELSSINTHKHILNKLMSSKLSFKRY